MGGIVYWKNSDQTCMYQLVLTLLNGRQ